MIIANANIIGSKKFSWSRYWTTQYQAVLDAMKAAGAEPNSYDKLRQARLMKRLVTEGYFAKAEFLDFFCVNAGASLINWKSPGTYDPTLISTPQFEAYQGYRGASGKAINLNFVSGINSTLTTQTNACQIMGIGDNSVGGTSDDFGSFTGSGLHRLSIRASHTDGKFYSRFNNAQVESLDNSDTIKHYAISRQDNTGYDIYFNKTKTSVVRATTGVSDKSLYACGSNENGTLAANNKMVRYVCRFSYLTESEVTRFMDIMDEYLVSYHSHIINYNNYIAKPYLDTRAVISLTTYDGSGQTLNPSMIDLGTAWNGYRYWLSDTPLPGNDSALENPSIWASNDGVTWVIPDGLTNPIVAKPAIGYNADVTLYFENNTLYCFWKENTTSNKIKVIRSTDGVTWGDIKTLYTCSGDEAEPGSPSPIKINGTYYLYYFTYNSTITNNFRVRRISCATIDGTYANPETCIIPRETGFIWWHHHVYFKNNAYYYISTASLTNGYGARVFVCKSTDGVNFTRQIYPILSLDHATYTTQALRGYYRPCISTIGADNMVYYGFINSSNVWGIMKMKIDLL